MFTVESVGIFARGPIAFFKADMRHVTKKAVARATAIEEQLFYSKTKLYESVSI